MKKIFYKFLIIYIFWNSIFSLFPQEKATGGNIFRDKKNSSRNIKIYNSSKDKEIPVPSLTGRIVDLTHTLSDYQIHQLEKKLIDLEKEKGSQIAVLIIPTTGIETIEEYSIKVAENWKIGRKGIDDGVILLIAKNDRKLRIEVGYGLEGTIPDAKAKRIIEEIIVPEFRNENFYEGIDKGLDAIINLIKGEDLPLPVYDEETEKIKDWFFWSSLISSFILHLFIGHFYAIIFVFVVFSIISIFIVGFSLSLLGYILFAAILGVTWYFFVLLNGGFRSSGGSGYRGGGGFSGGGGSFGGGGASGSW